MPRNANDALIETYFEMIRADDYAGVGDILTDDATWTIVPIGHTWTGRRAIESMAMAAGDRRRHDERSHVEIKNWFTDGEYLCVEYTHRLILGDLGLRLTVDGYCFVLHMRDGRFDMVREYINPPGAVAGILLYALLPLLPLLSRLRRNR